MTRNDLRCIVGPDAIIVEGPAPYQVCVIDNEPAPQSVLDDIERFRSAGILVEVVSESRFEVMLNSAKQAEYQRGWTEGYAKGLEESRAERLWRRARRRARSWLRGVFHDPHS